MQERALKEVRGPLDEPRLLSIAGWLQGEISIAALRRALDWLTERHTVLRTTFEQGKDGSYGQFVQRVASGLSDYPRRPRRGQRHQSCSKLSREPLDPGETCFRVGLITLRSDRHLLLMTFHPAIYDHWSAELILGELSTLYDAAVQNREPTDLAPLPFQLVDLAHWQQGLLQNHAFDRRIAFGKATSRRHFISSESPRTVIRGALPQVSKCH